MCNLAKKKKKVETTKEKVVAVRKGLPLFFLCLGTTLGEQKKKKITTQIASYRYDLKKCLLPSNSNI